MYFKCRRHIHLTLQRLYREASKPGELRGNEGISEYEDCRQDIVYYADYSMAAWMVLTFTLSMDQDGFSGEFPVEFCYSLVYRQR